MGNLVKTVSYLWILTVLLSCSSESESSICVSFDERQCGTDEWNTSQPGDDKDLAEEIGNYFNSMDIEILDIRIDENFHEFVCEACDVCPTGKRIFISIDSAAFQRVSELRLLSLESINCGDIF